MKKQQEIIRWAGVTLPILLLLSAGCQRTKLAPEEISLIIRHKDFDEQVNSRLMEFNGELYLQYQSRRDQTFCLRNVDRDSLCFALPLRDEFNIGARCPYVHSPDSIFLLSDWLRRLILLNSQGDTLKSIAYPEKPFAAHPTATSGNPMLFSHNKIVANVLYNDFPVNSKADVGRYYQRPMEVFFDLEKDTAWLGIETPVIYRKGKFCDDILPFHEVRGNELFMSWRALDSVYVYDLNTGRYKRKFQAVGAKKPTIGFIDFDQLNEGRTMGDLMNQYTVSNEFYTQIGFVPNGNKLWRLVKLSYPSRPEGDYRNPAQFYLFDLEGKVLCETTLDPFFRLMVTSRGFYFMDGYDQKKNETTFHYRFYSISQLMQQCE